MYQELREAWTELTGPGGAFEVVDKEVLGRTVRAYSGAPGSLRDIWLPTAGYADKDYMVYADERWTYTSAHAEVGAIASWLVSRGVGPGDRVAIAMRNYPEWMLTYWACVSIGATVVGMNAWWVGAELEYGLNDSTPKVLVCDRERLERYLEVRDKTSVPNVLAVRAGDTLPEGVEPFSVAGGSGGAMPEVDIDPDSDACVFYTSGTTGRPKGAQLTHRGCVTNLMSMAFWNTALGMARAKRGIESSGNAMDGLTTLILTPLFHVTANNCVAHGATAAGGKLVLMYKWDAGEALKLIEAEKVTNFSGVPTMARELIAHPDYDKHDTTSLKAVGGGGAQLQPDLVEKIESTGRGRAGTGYGMTECCGVISMNSADYFVDKPESVGPAMPSFEARCVDQDGKDVGPGEVGELWVKGSQIIRGYLNREEATEESITDGGWLHTGDVARIDEHGFIFIVDRAKDMVLRGGENVYCAEVEVAMFDHDDVVECAAFGVPDDRLGEEVGAAVVLKPGASLTGDALRAHLAERIAKFKIPRYLWFTNEALPRNASGKFLKRELRDTLDTNEAQ